MARKFKKNPSMTMVYVPGFGRLMGDTIIEGDQYARFAPAILVEVAEADVPKPVVPPPLPPPSAPAPEPVAEVVAPALAEIDSSMMGPEVPLSQSQGTLTVEDVWDEQPPVTPEESVVVDLGAQAPKAKDDSSSRRSRKK